MKRKKNLTQVQQLRASSMKHAAGLLGVDVHILKEAKAAGAPGFDDHNRVDLVKVKGWLAERGRLPKTPGERFRSLFIQLCHAAVQMHAFKDQILEINGGIADVAEPHQMEIAQELKITVDNADLAQAWEEFRKVIGPIDAMVYRLMDYDRAFKLSGFDHGSGQ